jgi:hypothetical protein
MENTKYYTVGSGSISFIYTYILITKWKIGGVMVYWVSEWLLFNANSGILQLYDDENKLIFNEMMMTSALI